MICSLIAKKGYDVLEHILFLDACVRGSGVSRTLEVAEVFFGEYITLHADAVITKLCLSEKAFKPYDRETLAYRERMYAEEQLDDPIFAHAKVFAHADKIVVAAPYWDCSFPAVLKAYIEHICVKDITFRCTDKGQEGICRARKALYITTAGGCIGECNFGYDYIRGAFKALLGISPTELLMADTLDLVESDAQAILDKVKAEAIAAAARF